MTEERFQLLGDFTPIQLHESGISLVAPGLFGQGTIHPRRTDPGGRSALGEQDELARAIDESGAEDRFTLVLDAPTPEAGSGGGGRGGGTVAHDEVLMQVPLGQEEGAFLLYVDEAGRVSYHFGAPEEPASPLPSSRSSGVASQATFRIPLRQARDTEAEGGRGLFSRITSKIIKVIVVKVIPDAAGGMAARGVRRWEERFRSHLGLHGGSWHELLAPTPTPAGDLGRLEGRRALLLIHGTTSTTAGAFARLTEQERLLERLRLRYGDRILGFNHHTMSRSVAENVQQFLDAFQGAPGRYTFDVIGHSRGGLLARALAARSSGGTLTGHPCRPPEGVEMSMDRIAFVATPNAGTAMARPDGIPGLVERLTNMVNRLPDSAPVIAAGALLALAAATVEAALPRLPGLADQAPGSDLQQELGPSPPNGDRWFALTAHYRPSGNLLDVVRSGAMDRIFGATLNDLVVPTDGVSATPFFTLAPNRVITFTPDRSVHHSA
ncbi:MAG: hypothetical protein EA421_16350, partial [Gemmatimonadales bacterium]